MEGINLLKSVVPTRKWPSVRLSSPIGSRLRRVESSFTGSVFITRPKKVMGPGSLVIGQGDGWLVGGLVGWWACGDLQTPSSV